MNIHAKVSYPGTHEASRDETTVICTVNVRSEEYLTGFFRNHYHDLCRHAVNLLKNESEAADVVGDVFVIIRERKNLTDIRKSLFAYSTSIVHNLCLNRIKHRMVERRHKNALICMHRENSLLDNPLTILIRKEISESCEKSMLRLSKQNKRIFMMSRLDGCTNPEIAMELGISVNTVKTMLRRSLTRVRADLVCFNNMPD